MTYSKKVSEILPLMQNIENIRNVGILAHIDHGKTTLSDSLLAYCGLLSPSLAGEARVLDFLEEEQKRGITIKTANISLPFKSESKSYIINLIDTPGHVDFSGVRDQSLRVIDGAIIVIDSVEGCMAQTEVVTKQALEEKIKPILFINKIDRLITELKLSLSEIEKRLVDIIQDFNNFIEIYALDDSKTQWSIRFEKGNIVFGSALHLWGCSANDMIRKNIKFRDILEFYKSGKKFSGSSQIDKYLPLSESIFNMIINNLPNPKQAQKYRIPKLWADDISSEMGNNLIECNPKGPALIYIYKNISDINIGRISVGRIFSGTIEVGQELFSLRSSTYNKIQQIFLFMGPHRESIKTLSAGNIVALSLKDSKIGDTLTQKNFEDIIPFEEISYETEAVVQYSVEPLHPRDIKKMLDILEEISINDPNLKTVLNEETGEILISGLGELHLEIIINELKKRSLEIIQSEPIVTYRESIQEKSEKITTSSLDSQNKITIQIEPLEKKVVDLLTEKKITMKMSRKRISQFLQNNTNWNKELIENLIYFDSFGNMVFLIDEKYNSGLNEKVLSAIQDRFERIFRFGPLIHDPIRGILVKIHNLSLKHETSQINIVQFLPLFKNGLLEAFKRIEPIILQPIYKIEIKTISSYIGIINSTISQCNGKILQINQKGQDTFISGQIPVAGTFNLASKLRSKTSGRIFFMTSFSHWEIIRPESYMKEIIRSIRAKRGISN